MRDNLYTGITQMSKNVTCKNLSNADERQAALDALEELAHVEMRLSLSDWGRICSTIRSALQSPRVPVINGLDEAISYNEGLLRATLQHARMIVKNHEVFPNTPLFLKLQAEETIKNSEMGLKLIEGASAYAELQKGV